MLLLLWPLAARRQKLLLLPRHPLPWPPRHLLLLLTLLPLLLLPPLPPLLALLLPLPALLMLRRTPLAQPRMLPPLPLAPLPPPPMPPRAPWVLLPTLPRLLPTLPRPLLTLSRSDVLAHPPVGCAACSGHGCEAVRRSTKKEAAHRGGFFMPAAGGRQQRNQRSSLTSKAAIRCPFSPTSVPPLDDSTVTLVLLPTPFSATR